MIAAQAPVTAKTLEAWNARRAGDDKRLRVATNKNPPVAGLAARGAERLRDLGREHLPTRQGFRPRRETHARDVGAPRKMRMRTFLPPDGVGCEGDAEVGGLPSCSAAGSGSAAASIACAASALVQRQR